MDPLGDVLASDRNRARPARRYGIRGDRSGRRSRRRQRTQDQCGIARHAGMVEHGYGCSCSPAAGRRQAVPRIGFWSRDIGLGSRFGPPEPVCSRVSGGRLDKPRQSVGGGSCTRPSNDTRIASTSGRCGTSPTSKPGRGQGVFWGRVPGGLLSAPEGRISGGQEGRSRRQGLVWGVGVLERPRLLFRRSSI